MVGLELGFEHSSSEAQSESGALARRVKVSHNRVFAALVLQVWAL